MSAAKVRNPLAHPAIRALPRAQRYPQALVAERIAIAVGRRTSDVTDDLADPQRFEAVICSYYEALQATGADAETMERRATDALRLIEALQRNTT